jgi:hypothetical protein
MKASAFSISVGLDRVFSMRTVSISTLAFSFLLFSVISASAQEHVHDDDCSALFGGSTRRYTIQYGSSIDLEVFNQTTETPSWRVQPVKGVSKSSGQGNVAGIQFNDPGRYEVTFTIPGDKHKGTSIVEVSDVRMMFDTKSVVLSQPIEKGVSVDGATLTIQVEASSYHKKPLEYTARKISTTGVTGISAELKEPVKLKNGTHVLTFHLTGTPEYAGTAQLGFFNLLGEGFFYNFLIAE